MKRLLLGSMIAATLLLTTGCDKDDTADTTAPVITTSATPPAVDVGGTVTLTATDANTVTFTEAPDSTMFTISGSTLTPEFVTGTNTVTVKATDSAGNASTKEITVTVTPASSGNGIVYGGLEWSALIAYDDTNDTTSGKQTQANAKVKCTALGKRLPTLEEIQKNALELKTDTAFRSDAGDNVIVWADENTLLTGYYFNGVDANVTSDDDEYNSADDANLTATTTNFYTCVETAQ